MQALDDRFELSGSGNSEILFAWLTHVVASRYEPAYRALESFLVDQGRRKFLQPLYLAMEQDESQRDLGRRIYAKARPGYHPISAAAIDAIQNPQPNRP
jgi:leukotriene-A4 hydrolase